MMNWTGRIGLVLTGAGLVWLATGLTSLHSQTASSSPMATDDGGLQMVSTNLPTGTQQIVVMDPKQKTMAVYQIDQGKIQLRSVRSLVYDLRLEVFNGQAPLPSELRKVQP